MQAMGSVSAGAGTPPSRGAGPVTAAQVTFDGLLGGAGIPADSSPGATAAPDPSEPEVAAVSSDAEDAGKGEEDEQAQSDLPAEALPDSAVAGEAKDLAAHPLDATPARGNVGMNGVMPGDSEVEQDSGVVTAGMPAPLVAGGRSPDTSLGDGETSPGSAKNASLQQGLGGSSIGVAGQNVRLDGGMTSDSEVGQVPGAIATRIPAAAPAAHGKVDHAADPAGATGQIPTEPAKIVLAQKGAGEPSSSNAIKGGDMRLPPSSEALDGRAHGTASAQITAAPESSETFRALGTGTPNANATAVPANSDPVPPEAVRTQAAGVSLASVEVVRNDAPRVGPDVPAAPDGATGPSPLDPSTTEAASLAPPGPDVAVDPVVETEQRIAIDRPTAPGAMDAELQALEAAGDRPADPVRPRSAIVPNVVDRIAALPREVGETIVHLKPHGMGLIEVSIQQARDGGLDIVLRIQNPMVLEAMQSERQAVAQALASQGGAASGSLSMDLFQPGTGQRSPQREGSSTASESGSDAGATKDSIEEAAGQAVPRQIVHSDRVNIIT